jgi:hypothetical protein
MIANMSRGQHPSRPHSSEQLLTCEGVANRIRCGFLVSCSSLLLRMESQVEAYQSDFLNGWYRASALKIIGDCLVWMLLNFLWTCCFLEHICDKVPGSGCYELWMSFLAFRILDDGQGPETQWSWLLRISNIHWSGWCIIRYWWPPPPGAPCFLF